MTKIYDTDAIASASDQRHYVVSGMMGLLRFRFGSCFIDRGMQVEHWLVFLRIAPGLFLSLPEQIRDFIVGEDRQCNTENDSRSFVAGSAPLMAPTYGDVEDAQQLLEQTAEQLKLRLPELVSPEPIWRAYRLAKARDQVRFFDGKTEIGFDSAIEPIMSPLAFQRYVGNAMYMLDDSRMVVVQNFGTRFRADRFVIKWGR